MHGDTKKMIAEQLFRILEHKKLEDVTIKYLVDACGISRQTFYYHFQDIIDVLEWGMRLAVEQDLAKSLQTQDPRDAIRIFLVRVVRNRDVTRSLLKSKRREEFEQILLHGFYQYLQELFRRKWPNPSLSVADIEVLLDFYTYGLMGLLIKHCQAKELDEDLLVDQIYRLISGEMTRQLPCP